MTKTSYDFIPDIHADAARLTSTLWNLGYTYRQGCWRAPKGRMAVFLGDFIDTGTQNAFVLGEVRKMIEAGQAHAIMGNHELNAIHYLTPGLNVVDYDKSGYMRAHNDQNTRQTQTFLAEYPLGSKRAADIVEFFMSLPIFLDLGGIRVVHAAWNEDDVAVISAKRPDARLQACDLEDLAMERTEDPFIKAVLACLKGPEIKLPDGCGFHDHKSDYRTSVRLKWWNVAAHTWADIAASVPNRSELPSSPVPDLAGIVNPGTVPVVFGHYKRKSHFEIDAPLALCLDYPDRPMAYRWDGEETFLSHKIVFAGPSHI
jgi:hypothetical protein